MENSEAKPNPAIETAENTVTELSILLEDVNNTTSNPSPFLESVEKTAERATSELNLALDTANKTPSKSSDILETAEKTA